MGSESALWGYLSDQCRPLGADLVRIENRLEAGTPDVNGSWRGRDFWWELKHVDFWPKRASTPLRIEHYTVDQRKWLRRRGMAGGAAGLMLQVDREYMVFNWFYAQVVGRLPRGELLPLAAGYWRGSVDANEILQLSINLQIIAI